MIGADDAGIDGIGQMGLLRDLAVAGFNDHIVALGEAMVPGGFRMYFQLRMGFEQAQFFDPAIGRMQIIAALGAGQDQRIFRIILLRAALCIPAEELNLNFSAVLSVSSTFPVGVRNPFSS